MPVFNDMDIVLVLEKKCEDSATHGAACESAVCDVLKTTSQHRT
jgi:hypothetical protein